MRRALGLAFALVAVTATPAFAHVAVDPVEVRWELVAAGGDEHGDNATEDGAAYGDAEGEDGTDPVAFAALLLAGMAAMAAVAALIYATKRAPS